MAKASLSRRIALAAVLGAALGVTGLAAFADAPKAPKAGHSPDPPPQPSRAWWVFEMTSKDGKVSIDKARAITLDKPAATPRVFGRFAIELYVGKELLDRVRFDVPLMGAEPPQQSRKVHLPRPSFERGVSVKLTARMAESPRAAYMLLVDRESGDAQRFEWPPDKSGQVVPWRQGLVVDGGAWDGAAMIKIASDGGLEGGLDGGADAAPKDAGKPLLDAAADAR